MTRYVGPEPWPGWNDVVAVDMEGRHHELRASYDFVRLEFDGESLLVSTKAGVRVSYDRTDTLNRMAVPYGERIKGSPCGGGLIVISSTRSGRPVSNERIG